jgi:hypothetical protein
VYETTSNTQEKLMSTKKSSGKKPPEKTSPKDKTLAGVALKNPGKVTKKEVRSLAGSVLSHIQPRDKAKK